MECEAAWPERFDVMWCVLGGFYVFNDLPFVSETATLEDRHCLQQQGVTVSVSGYHQFGYAEVVTAA